MGYYSKLLIAHVEKGMTIETATQTQAYIDMVNYRVESAQRQQAENKMPFAVHTAQRDAAGMKPYIVWGISEDSVARRFYKAYKISPANVVPVEFDGKTGEWIEKP